MSHSGSHPGARLRALVEEDVVSIPGAFNALVARAVRDAGFRAAYVSGGATANVAGFPDVGMLTMIEVCRTIREIADASMLPVIADADTSYGEVEARSGPSWSRAAERRLHVEDQIFPSVVAIWTARNSWTPRSSPEAQRDGGQAPRTS